MKRLTLCFYDGRVASWLSLVYEITHIAMLSHLACFLILFIELVIFSVDSAIQRLNN